MLHPMCSLWGAVRLGLTLIYAEDFATMYRFYRDILGLEQTDADPVEGHGIGVDLAQFATTPTGRLELFDHARFGTRLEFPRPRANATVVTFEVDDLDAEAGVEFFSRRWFSWGGAAHFLDPEGNHLQIFQDGLPEKTAAF
jgi:catechol 2,3-dioxygenase-like lactoylglutathione lyase family enzyme